MDLEPTTSSPRAIGFPLSFLRLTPLPSGADVRAVDASAGHALFSRSAAGGYGVSGL